MKTAARSTGRTAGDNRLTALLLLPGVGFLLLAIALPLLQLLLGSFGISGIGVPGHFTLQYYGEVVQDFILTSSFRFSLQIALVATAASIVVATVLTGILQVNFPGRALVSVLCKVPLVVPSLVAAFMVLTIIGPGGMAARLVRPLGIIWPSLLDDPSGAGIILVLLWNSVPVTILIISAVAASIPRDLIQSAQTLGAGPWRIFTRIMVPLCAPGIAVAGLLVFIGSFGSFAIPSLIGPAFPRAISVVMTNEFLLNANWGVASVLGVAMVATTIVVLLLYSRLTDRRPELRQ